MTSKPLVVEEAIIEELVENNQLLANVNNLIEPSKFSTDKVELTELPKKSILPSGLSILSDVFSFLAYPNCSTTNTLELLHFEDKKRGLARFMQIK